MHCAPWLTGTCIRALQQTSALVHIHCIPATPWYYMLSGLSLRTVCCQSISTAVPIHWYAAACASLLCWCCVPLLEWTVRLVADYVQLEINTTLVGKCCRGCIGCWLPPCYLQLSRAAAPVCCSKDSCCHCVANPIPTGKGMKAYCGREYASGARLCLSMCGSDR